MLEVIKKIRTNQQVKSAIQKTALEEAPLILSSFLKEHGDCAGVAARHALDRIAIAPWDSLWIGLALIDVDADEAIVVIRKILESNLLAWSDLEPEHQQKIIKCLLDKRQTELCLTFMETSGAADLTEVFEQMTDDRFQKWIDGKLDHRESYGRLQRILLSYLDKVSRYDESDSKRQVGFIRLHGAAAELWNHEALEESAELLKTLAALRSEFFEPGILRTIAAALPDLVPREPGKIVLAGAGGRLDEFSPFAKNEFFIPPLPPSLARCTDILRFFPSSQWIESLKTCWIEVSNLYEDTVGRTRRSKFHPTWRLPAMRLPSPWGAVWQSPSRRSPWSRKTRKLKTSTTS